MGKHLEEKGHCQLLKSTLQEPISGILRILLFYFKLVLSGGPPVPDLAGKLQTFVVHNRFLIASGMPGHRKQIRVVLGTQFQCMDLYINETLQMGETLHYLSYKLHILLYFRVMKVLQSQAVFLRWRQVTGINREIVVCRQSINFSFPIPKLT